MASKPSRTTNFSEQEKLVLAELGRDEVGPSLLADVEAIIRKGAAKVTKKENSQKYNNF